MVIPVDREGRVIDSSMGRKTNEMDEPNTRKGGGRDDKETPKVHYMNFWHYLY